MKNTIENLLTSITNAKNVGLLAMVAMTQLRRAVKQGEIITDKYAYVDYFYLKQKRADCLQAMGKDAWVKSKDEERPVDERLALLETIEGYKKKGDFGWLVFNISELDFYTQKIVLEVNEFTSKDWNHQGDFFAAILKN